MFKQIILLAAISTGCAPYTQAQLDLTTQARRGVAMIGQSLDRYADVADQIHAMQRQRLDQAFDADVASQNEISADWVIEARQAYAVAIDSLARQRVASRDAVEADKSNLAAVDATLQRLAWLQGIELRYAKIGEQVSRKDR